MNKPLLITSGEPAGIGMDVVLSLYANGELQTLNRTVVVLADEIALRERAQMLNIQVNIAKVNELIDIAATDVLENAEPNDKMLYVLDVPCAEPVIAGELCIENAAQVIQQLTLAADLALANKVAAIVTAPVQKSVINDAVEAGLVDLTDTGGKFSGHTEFFQQKAQQDDVVMMLANDKLKVALVTTHLPLKNVPDAITTEKLTTVIDILLADMHAKFGKPHPKILVCGLNPHAGEGGHLGLEEIATINPLLQTYIDKGVDMSLAQPADTLFSPQNMQDADCFLAMYHDQGLTVLKALGFGETVNITLGLPFIRTSVDHGTALDIAGTGNASASSLLAALKLADELAY